MTFWYGSGSGDPGIRTAPALFVSGLQDAKKVFAYYFLKVKVKIDLINKVDKKCQHLLKECIKQNSHKGTEQMSNAKLTVIQVKRVRFDCSDDH